MAKAGRPSKLKQEITYVVPDKDGAPHEETLTVEESILRAVRLGVPQKYAAQQAGINEHTLSTWISRGSEWMDSPEKAPAGERDYAHFAHSLRRAKGAAVSWYATKLREQAGKGNVRAIMEWLRTQAADEFKQRITIEDDRDRTPAPINQDDAAAHERAFAAAFQGDLPELDPADFAPEEA